MGLVYYILLVVTAFGAEPAANKSVNKALQNTQNQLDVEQNSAAKLSPEPIHHVSPTLSPPQQIEITPLSPEEQFNIGERPRGAHIKAIDPEEPVREEIKSKQQYEKFKKNYEKAIIKEVQSKQTK